jgi:hypothetical protein
MAKDAWSHYMVEMDVISTPAGGFCCAWFIKCVSCYLCCMQTENSFIDLAQDISAFEMFPQIKIKTL